MSTFLKKHLPLAYGRYFNLAVHFSKKKTAARAFSLFCTVRKGKVLEKQKEFLNKAKLAVDSVENHKIQSYKWSGKKETVLLLHGWESNTFRWRNLIAKLKEANFNIIAFDAPSHGYSTGKELNVPLYTECTQHFIKKHKPKYIVAHSIGGMNALYNQYKYPDSTIKKIVTIGSPSSLEEIMNQYKTILRYNNKVEDALDDYFMNRFGFNINSFSTAKFVQSNSKKGMLFHDKLDAIAPFHASEKVHANWKGSTFIKTKGLGHSMHQEEVNNQIIEFLNN